jgi:hypothetical protein
MRTIILAAALAVLSVCAHAAERFNPGDVKTGEPNLTPGGKYVNYLVEDGVCISESELTDRAVGLGLLGAGIIHSPKGPVLVLTATEMDYAEGWLVTGHGDTCLLILTYKAGGGSA